MIARVTEDAVRKAPDPTGAPWPRSSHGNSSGRGAVTARPVAVRPVAVRGSKRAGRSPHTAVPAAAWGAFVTAVADGPLA